MKISFNLSSSEHCSSYLKKKDEDHKLAAPSKHQHLLYSSLPTLTDRAEQQVECAGIPLRSERFFLLLLNLRRSRQ